MVFNASQADTDGDQQGNACDLDDDNDVPDDGVEGGSLRLGSALKLR